MSVELGQALEDELARQLKVLASDRKFGYKRIPHSSDVFVTVSPSRRVRFNVGFADGRPNERADDRFSVCALEIGPGQSEKRPVAVLGEVTSFRTVGDQVREIVVEYPF